jgi:glucosamine--fructose-6-phosphate aminotransferase (isomerizing)
MCGIIGVLANRPAAPLLVEALKRLEYRGYDSAGVATLDAGPDAPGARAGKLAALDAALAETPAPGAIGIGHTRWATHGAPTVENAHPHRAGAVAVVHNGIIENFRALREALEAEGVRFETETDTEVVAQLCAQALARGRGPLDAAAETLARSRAPSRSASCSRGRRTCWSAPAAARRWRSASARARCSSAPTRWRWRR